MHSEGRQRVVIENVKPQIEGGKYPAKRVIGEKVDVTADIYTDGHDHINADLLWKKEGEKNWRRVPMRHLGNDLWTGAFRCDKRGGYLFTLEAWVDHFETWQEDLVKKHKSGQDLAVEFQIGAQYLEQAAGGAPREERALLESAARKLQSSASEEKKRAAALSDELTLLMRETTRKAHTTHYPKELRILCTREKALFSTWYELFPRSCGKGNTHGTFKDVIKTLPRIAKMGFDVLYLPPIHPIGITHRKGKNNSLKAEKDAPGSPWAIGAKAGGHDAIYPELGSEEELKQLIKKAKALGLDIALDLAFQCSPDHPDVKKHLSCFRWLPDGTVQYAENPPKKYEDIIPFYFETDDWEALWQELKRVVVHWVKLGVTIFRVDNPHTKPFAFWEWLISGVKTDHPEVLFLSEAFTRPKVMQRLAKIGFDQSYTYFTWRNNKHELTQYLTELTRTDLRDYFRPNFWPNTPDILPEVLQWGGRPAFMVRLLLAATLSSNYGIYGPAYELCIKDAIQGKEEYNQSEKYEIYDWDFDRQGNITDFIGLVNQIRKDNKPLQTTWNIEFCSVDNDHLLAYLKWAEEGDFPMLVVVSLDFFNVQSGWVELPLHRLGISDQQDFVVHDLLTDEKYQWRGHRNFVQLNPATVPAHLFRIESRMHSEKEFANYR